MSLMYQMEWRGSLIYRDGYLVEGAKKFGKNQRLQNLPVVLGNREANGFFSYIDRTALLIVYSGIN